MGKDLRDYGIVFRDVVGNNKLSYGARTLYTILCTFRDRETNTCFPGTELLCEYLGTSNRTRINGWFKELEDIRVVRRDTRFNNLNGRKIRSILIMDSNYE